jgi:hypothetical protein
VFFVLHDCELLFSSNIFIVVFLMKAGICDRSKLQTMSDKDHRDRVIGFIHTNTGEPESSLQSLTDHLHHRPLSSWMPPVVAILGG